MTTASQIIADATYTIGKGSLTGLTGTAISPGGGKTFSECLTVTLETTGGVDVGPASNVLIGERISVLVSNLS
jgi:hypothetical protein